LTVKKRTLAIFLISAVTLVALLASAWMFVSHELSRLDTYRESITNIAGEALHRDVDFETVTAGLTLRRGLTFHLTDVRLTERDRSSDFLDIKAVSFRVHILPLLIHRLVFSEVVLEQPRLSLKRDREGALNIADLLTRGETKTTLGFREITIENGTVVFLDRAARDEGLVTSLNDLSCAIDSSFWKKYRFHITTAVTEDGNTAELALEGTIRPARNPMESTVEASIHVRGTDMHHYHPYLEKIAPVEQLAGTLDAEATWSGTLSRFTSKGTVTAHDALLAYPGVFRDILTPRLVHVDWALTREAGRLTLDIGRLAVDRFEAGGRVDIHDMDTEDPLLEATAATSPFSLAEARPYIPWGIIPANAGSFIETHVTEGDFRLVEAKLAGRLSRISRIDEEGNEGVLSLRAEISGGVFEAGGSAPVFHDISGMLELEDRRFSLRKMQGNFGNSPFTMEGGISDFALPRPAVYTAEATLQPAREEVLWLMGKERFRSFTFDGTSTLLLSGKGTADDYHVSARWDLTDAAYAYPGVMEKPGARENRLTAEIIIHTDSIEVPSFEYDLPPVRVSGSATSRFSGGTPLSVSIRSTAFDLGEVLPLLPGIRGFDPAGTCSIDVTGRGDLGDPGSMQWEGEATLADVSLKPPVGPNRVTGLTGKALFTGTQMETSLFTARIGGSAIQGRFGMPDFRKPEFICQFHTDLLRTADLGLTSPEGEVNLHRVRGQIAFQSEAVHVYRLSFGLGKSRFTVSGDVKDFAGPDITAELVSPHIDSDDVARLMYLEYPKQEGGTAPSGMEVNAALRVDAGTFHGIDFTRLNAELRYVPGTVDVAALEVDCFEGTFKARGTVGIRPDGRHRYEGNISVDGMLLENIQRYLGIQDRTVTGTLSLTGDVSAAGSSAEELKKTAAGAFQVRAEQGVLKKYSVLSKIFSLLNVSQLAKLRLPDMAKEGMPYKRITSSMSLENGVLSSEDFFIKSNAMEISGVGTVDVLKKEIDCTVGVHPLQTVDLIVSKIPIAGWILTDERGKLITVHFKVDGTWDNPNVKAITARSIGKGILDIFRRIFQLPGKLITDTGEVILGK